MSLAQDGLFIAGKETTEKNAHSKILTFFIDEILKENNISPRKLDAVAVSKGPGSYTGLRIGVSAAKGLCYAVDKPLISVNTLQAMANGMKQKFADNFFGRKEKMIFCPMIDARRMEVYNALYDCQISEIRKTKAEIINEDSFSEYLANNKILFFGDGAPKCKPLLSHQQNAKFFDNFVTSSKNMISLAYKKYQESEFEDIAYFEPFYLKDFIAGISKVKGLK